jgi:hypothetical protein
MPRLLRHPDSRSSQGAQLRTRRGSILFAASFALAGVALLLTMVLGGLVQASTPTTLGYRDFGFGGALASRPTSDPEQSKLWYNDGAWWGGLFVSSGTGSGGSHFNIFKFSAGTETWTDTGRQVDIRDLSHGDYLWDAASNKLYVASSKSICTFVPTPPTQPCNDSIRVYRYSYNAASATLLGKYTLDTGFPKVLKGGQYNGGNFTGGGSNAVTITRDSAGEVWVAYTRDDPTTAGPPITGFHSNVYLAHSADGVTWTAPVRFAGAADGQLSEDNTASIVAFGGSKVGLYWTDKHASGASSAFFAVHADGDPDTTWSSPETVVSATNGVDDQVNLKADSAGKVYAVIRTDLSDQVRLYDRTTGGTWTGHNVTTAANANTRAQVVIDEELGLVYVFSTSGGTAAGTIYVKAAPLSSLTFPTGKGAAFIASASDKAIDDATLTKQTVSAATGILAEAGDRVTFELLHRFMTLAATDNTAPSGTATIDSGAAFTGVTNVTMTVPATDAGSGVAIVRFANGSNSTDGSGMLDGSGAASQSWAPSVPWTIASGDGVKTVWTQWQDHAGNWSAPVSATIGLDQTGPNGSVTINNGDVETSSATVSLDVTATDAGVGVVSNVRIANVGTTAGGILTDPSAVTSAYSPTKSWDITPGPDGPRTVYVQWQDSLGNWSGISNDSINLHDVVNPVGHVAINGGAAGVHSLSVNLNFPLTGADVTQVKISNSPTMAGAVFQAFAPSIPWTLPGPLTNRAVKSVYVVFKDGAGNISDPIGTTAYSATDSAIVDLTKPVLRGVVTTSWVSGTTLVGNTISLRATWPAATDTITGVGGYRVWLSRDGGAFTFIGTRTGRTAYILASASHTYRFRVYAVDRAGNASFSVYSPTVRTIAYQDTNAAVHFSSGWHSAASVSYYGGTARYTTARGAAASLTFTGRSVAWNAVLATNRGSARVYVDGHLIATVNLNAASTTVRRIVFTRTWSTSGTHTIRIVGLGTSGHPRVDVDAFLVLR